MCNEFVFQANDVLDLAPSLNLCTGIPPCKDHGCKDIPLVRTKLAWDGMD